MPKYIRGLFVTNVSCECSTEGRVIPEIELGVFERAPRGGLVQPVHASVAPVFCQTTHEQRALLLVEEPRGFGPVGDEELGRNGQRHSRQALEDEDPPPAAVSADSVHIVDAVGEELHRSVCPKIGSWGSYPTKCAGDDASAEEDVESPLELVAAVVHVDQVYAS